MQSSQCGAFSHCGSFSRVERRLWGVWASVVARGLSSCSSQALEHRLNSCGRWTDLFLDMWDLSESGTEPMSPALAGRFFTTEPPGKPQESTFLIPLLFPPPTPYIQLPCCKRCSKFCILLSPLRSVFIFVFSVASKVCTWYIHG